MSVPVITRYVGCKLLVAQAVLSVRRKAFARPDTVWSTRCVLKKCVLKLSMMGVQAVQSTEGTGSLKETVPSRESLNQFFREGRTDAPPGCSGRKDFRVSHPRGDAVLWSVTAGMLSLLADGLS